MATVQAGSSVAAQPCQTTMSEITDGNKANQSPSFPDLQRNSLVSEDSNGGSDALKILREQLRSSVSSTFAPGGGNVGSAAKSVNEEKCSTPLVSHTQSQQQFRSIGHSLSSIPSPIPRQAASTPCSPRNGLNVLQALSAGQLTSPVQRMASTSSAHPSSIISSYTSSASGSSVFAPMSAGRGLMKSHSAPGTPPRFHTMVNSLLSPLGIAAHAAQVARSGAGETVASSPSTSPRPSILRKRNSEGVNKLAATAAAAISGTSASKGDKSAKTSQASAGTAAAGTASATDSPAPARKKPRKQNMVTTEDPLASNVPPAEVRTTSVVSTPTPTTTTIVTSHQKESIHMFPYRKRMPANFGTGYKSSVSTGTKSTLCHFQRSTDVRVKDEKRPTIGDLAAQRSRLHDLNGWKVDCFLGNLSTLENMEKNKIDIINSYIQQVSAVDPGSKAVEGELHAVTELLKGNLQRSKVLIEHIEEARQHLKKLTEHRPRVLKVFSKFNGHRSSGNGNGRRKG